MLYYLLFKYLAAIIKLKKNKNILKGNLILEPLHLQEAEKVFELFSQPEVMACYDIGPIEQQESPTVFTYRIMKGSNHIWTIRRPDLPQEIIGVCALHKFDKTSNSIEIGGTLKPSLWGNNIMKSAFEQLIEFAANEINVRTVIGRTLRRNYAAIRLVKKLGFKTAKVTEDETFLELNLRKQIE